MDVIIIHAFVLETIKPRLTTDYMSGKMKIVEKRRNYICQHVFSA